MSQHESSFSPKPFPSLSSTPHPSKVITTICSSTASDHLNYYDFNRDGEEGCISIIELVNTEHNYSRPFDPDSEKSTKKKSIQHKKLKKQKITKFGTEQASKSRAADASSDRHSIHIVSGSDHHHHHQQQHCEEEQSVNMEDERTGASGANDSTTLSASGRVQRIRKKPKRWEDEDLEVDFTGRVQFLKSSSARKSTNAVTNTAANTTASVVKESPTVNKHESLSTTANSNTTKRESLTNNNNSNKKTSITPKVIVVNNRGKKGGQVSKRKKDKEDKPSSSSSSEGEDDQHSDGDESKDSNFGSDDDPEKLWCVCRQPYDRRFMIGCDACEEWFHGKCVNLTKVQGRKMEKLKQEWFCPWCQEELAKGVSRELLKQIAQQKMADLDAAAKAKKEAKNKTKKQSEGRKSDMGIVTKRSTPTITTTTTRKRHDSMSKEELSSEDEKPIPTTPRKEKEQPKPQKEAVKKASKVEKELEESRRLKMLIKASKKDLEKKVALQQSSSMEQSFDQSALETNIQSQVPSTPTSNNVVSPDLPKKPDITPKRKKLEIVDDSVHDLFKADKVLVRSQSVTSVGTPTTPTTPRKVHTPSSVEDRRRQSITISSPAKCPPETLKTVNCGSCGKSISLKSECPSIYCNATCIQNYVIESVKLLRGLKKQREKTNSELALKPLKVPVFDKINHKVLAGSEALAEKDVLDFISKNPTYEIQKPPKLEEPKTPVTNSSAASVSAKVTTPTTPTKPNVIMLHVTSNKSDLPKKERTSSISISSTSTMPSGPGKLERSSSISNDDASRRNFVKNALTDIFNTRKSELSEKEKEKIANVEFSKLSAHIEEELFKIFKTTNHKYNVKSRSLIFNLKDPKNSLFSRVLLGEISPEKLVNMAPQELASSELARWREQETKTMIELIKRDAVDQANQVIVKKTHKGEEIIVESEVVADLTDVGIITKVADNDNNENKEEGEDAKSKEIVEEQVMKLKEKEREKPPVTIVKEKPVVDVTQSSGSPVVAVKSEPKAPTVKTPTPKTTPSPVFDIFDDTPNHGSHVFSNNCKICMGLEKESEKPKEKELKRVSDHGSSSASKVLKGDQAKSQHQPKRVRVEHESTNKFLEEAFKLSDKLLAENPSGLLTESPNVDSPNGQTSSETVVKHVETKRHRDEERERRRSRSIWKGTIYMQDVANFVATAYIVTGSSLIASLPNSKEKITVCGRIAPEQVLDYIGKLKKSKRTEIGIVQFVWATREERTGYDAFFNYLNMRGRYGVVDNTGRAFKDFYIMPLSKNKAIPPVLLPSDGVPLDKAQRPNLLLGVMILANRKSSSSTTIPQSVSQSSNANDKTMERSYTPPLTNNAGSTTPPLDIRPDDDDDGGYTPPHPSTSAVVPSAASVTVVPSAAKRTLSYEDAGLESSPKVGKYDPTVRITLAEASMIHSHQSNSDQLSSSNKISEAKQTDLSKLITAHKSPSRSSQLNTQSEKRIPDKVSPMPNVESQVKNDTESNVDFMSSINANSVAPIQPDLINNINLSNIQIPDNLANILKSIQTKPSESNGPRMEEAMAPDSTTSDSAPLLMKPQIHSTNNHRTSGISTADPRIRIKQAALKDQDMRQPQPLVAPVITNSEPVPTLSQDELLRKMAQEQMAALAQYDPTPKRVEPDNAPVAQSNHSVPQGNSIGNVPFIQPPAPQPVNVPARSGFFSSTGMVPGEAVNQAEPSASLPKISFSWKRKK